MNTKAIEKLEKELAKKNDALANLEKRKAELERNIKDMKASIDETVADIDREKLELLKKSAKAQGLNVDDLLAMFLSGGSPVASAQADTQEDNSVLNTSKQA